MAALKVLLVFLCFFVGTMYLFSDAPLYIPIIWFIAGFIWMIDLATTER